MHIRRLTAIVIAAVLVGSQATAAVSRVSASPGPASAFALVARTGSATPRLRPDRADWEKIKSAAGLRRLALAPHRTARFRAFSASLGLNELVSVHRLAPGRCANAVTDLFDNLLDLDNAYPGENWAPLRRLVAKQPSLHACAPRPAKRHLPTLLS